MITVVPAKTTALPAVARARAIDSTGSRPSPSWRSVPRQDEQRVVDADREAQHLRQGRRGARDGDEVRDHDHRRERHADADERGEDRHAGREQRAERHRQDQEGDEQAEQLGDLARVRACLVGVAADRRGHRRPGRRRSAASSTASSVSSDGTCRRSGSGPSVARGPRCSGSGWSAVSGLVMRHPVDLVDRCRPWRDLGGVRRVGDLARRRRRTAPGRWPRSGRSARASRSWPSWDSVPGMENESS